MLVLGLPDAQLGVGYGVATPLVVLTGVGDVTGVGFAVEVGLAVGDGVGVRVGTAVGVATGEGLGDGLAGPAVGVDRGVDVGALDGVAVAAGDIVAVAVASAVGVALDVAVGAELGEVAALGEPVGADDGATLADVVGLAVTPWEGAVGTSEFRPAQPLSKQTSANALNAFRYIHNLQKTGQRAVAKLRATQRSSPALRIAGAMAHLCVKNVHAHEIFTA